ncbi:MAG: BlaI/MecI/CopY family transcriptional regulator [Bacillota bacterium]
MKYRIPAEFRLGMRGLDKVLGKLESEIMEVVWRKGCQVSIRDVYEEIQANRKIAYTTVMTVMSRLAAKKLLQKWSVGNTHYFLPTITREEFTRSVVGKVMDSLLDDFADVTLAHFIQRVQKDDRETIHRLETILAAHKEEELQKDDNDDATG